MNIKIKVLLNPMAIGIVFGVGYLMYKKGRVDEINEICHIVHEHGENKFTFHTKKFKNMTISMIEV